MCSRERVTVNNNTRRDTQRKLKRMTVMPVLTYKSEIWTITKRETKF
jgi:hypothetical protein